MSADDTKAMAETAESASVRWRPQHIVAALDAVALALPTTLGAVLLVYWHIGAQHLAGGLLAAIAGLVLLHLFSLRTTRPALFSARLFEATTLAAMLAQLPQQLPGWGLPEKQQFDVVYEEGSDVGYRRFAAKGMKPLFPFGHGLSYTTFAYDKLKVKGGETLEVSFQVTNTGKLQGKDAPQIYLAGANGQKLQRLIGFEKIDLKPGERRTVTIKADPRLLARFDEQGHQWQIEGGDYDVVVGRSATMAVLTGKARVSQRTLKP